jgi:hypothetical protein
MPWRKKPASYLQYWTGPLNRDAGFKTVLVYCTGTLDASKGYHGSCHHRKEGGADQRITAFARPVALLPAG